MPQPRNAVIVPARDAWPEYLSFAAYVCQPDRPFRPDTTHLGFYCGGAIQPLVPVIERWLPAVLFTHRQAAELRSRWDRRLADLVDRLLDAGPRTDGASYGVMLLSAPESPDTVRLASAIKNDLVSPGGRTAAWTQNQRYVDMDRLRSGVEVTSQLGAS